MNFEYKSIKVRYCETDQMGFVHHSNYLKYFEVARIEWLYKMGISYAQMEKDGILMPVVSADLKFKKPLLFGDEIKIIVYLNTLPKVTLDFSYQIINQHEEKVCFGDTKLAFLDVHKNRPIRCPKELTTVFESWEK